MLEYDETMALLDEMKPHYDDGFTSSERGAIESLYNNVCGKPIRRSGCSDCYRDAYIELVTTLKRLGTMPTISNYVLKAGAVLHEFGSSDFYTLNNCPDEFAEKWLARYPQDFILFEKYPSDWKERVAKVKAALEGSNNPKDNHDGDVKDTQTPSEKDIKDVNDGNPEASEKDPEEEKPTDNTPADAETASTEGDNNLGEEVNTPTESNDDEDATPAEDNTPADVTPSDENPVEKKTRRGRKSSK